MKIHVGILYHQGGSIDAFRLTHDLLAYNTKKGLRIFDKNNLNHAEYKKSGVTLKTKTGHTIKPKKVICCTGFESVELIKEPFAYLLSTYEMIGEGTNPDEKKLADIVFWNTIDPYIYMRKTNDNRLPIGGEDEEFVDAKKWDETIPNKVAKLRKYLSKIIPDYDFIPDFAWSGTFGETKDGLLYIGKYPNFQSTYFVLKGTSENWPLMIKFKEK